MSANIAELHTDEIPPRLERQIEELLASYEVAMERLAVKERDLEDRYQATQQFIDSQINKVNSLLKNLREIMTEAGAARWRLAAQETLQLGDKQLAKLRKISSDANSVIKESCNRFERTSSTAVKNVNDAINTLKLDEFKSHVEQSYIQMKITSISGLEKIFELLRWFHWKNLALALGISLVIALVIGLYINDEWPWEMHQDVIKERTAGKALISAWPHLSKQDRQFIKNKIFTLSQK